MDVTMDLGSPLPPIVSPGSRERPGNGSFAPRAGLHLRHLPGRSASFAGFRLFQGNEPPTLTLMQRVAVAAVERIVDGRYPPGSLLPESALAEEFQISKAPVSEALVLVESTGLLDETGRRGARVAPLSLEDFEDLMHYRSLLLPFIVSGFLEHGESDGIAVLTSYAEELERLVGDDSKAFAFLEAGDRAALYIALQSGYRRIARALCLMSLQYLRYTHVAYRAVRDRRSLLAHWNKVLAALKARDLEAALAANRALGASRRDVIAGELARAGTRP
jgi:DNA-binding GntR family transcriptional regulator